MKKILATIILLSSVSLMASDCIEYSKGGYRIKLQYCVNDKVLAITDDSTSKKNDLVKPESGIIVSVQQTGGPEWFQIKSSITVKLNTGKTIELHPLEVFHNDPDACHTYLVDEGWSSKEVCVGDFVAQDRFIRNSNLSAKPIEPREVFAIGAAHALMKDAHGELTLGYYFKSDK